MGYYCILPQGVLSKSQMLSQYRACIVLSSLWHLPPIWRNLLHAPSLDRQETIRSVVIGGLDLLFQCGDYSGIKEWDHDFVMSND